MKETVSCDHCGKRFRADADRIPPHGRSVNCPACTKPFTIMKPDAFYEENHSPEVASYIIYRKHNKQSSNVQYDLQRVGELELWLEKRQLSLANAGKGDLNQFCNEINERFSPGKVEGIKTTISNLYEILVREKVVAATPFVHHSPGPEELASISDSEVMKRIDSIDTVHMADEGDEEADEAGETVAVGRFRRLGRMVVLFLVILFLGGFAVMRHLQLQETEAKMLEALRKQQEMAEQARLAEAEWARIEAERKERQRLLAEEKRQMEEKKKAEREAEESRQRAEEELQVRAEEERVKKLDAERQLVRNARLQMEKKRRLELQKWADAEIDELKKDREGRQRVQAGPEELTGKKTGWRSRCVKGDCQNGEGTFQFPNGDIYSGGWRQFKRSGYGVYTYANGNRYEGYWKDNLRSGKGTFLFANGDKHIGMWRNGERAGPISKHLKFAGYLAELQRKKEQAMQRLAEERARRAQLAASRDQSKERVGEMTARGVTGCVKGDCENGWGQYIYNSGDNYSGEWRDGQKHGKGTYTFKSGDYYQGYWRGDLKHGQGTYRFRSGQMYQGGWFNGKNMVGGASFLPMAGARPDAGAMANGSNERPVRHPW